jgi:hypothetical protein
MYSANSNDSTSSLKRDGIPLLTRSDDGRTNYQQWSHAIQIVAKSTLGLIQHLTTPYALVDTTFNGVELTLPSPPVKYEPFIAKVKDDTEDKVLKRRTFHHQNVEFYMLEMKQYEFELQQFNTNGEEARQAKYDLNDNKVLSLILATVDPTISASFQPGLHAYELWTYLATTFGTTSQLTKGAVYRELVTGGIEEGQPPQTVWDKCLRTQRDLKGSPFEIPTALLQQIYLLMFAQVELYTFVYQKFRSIELHSGSNFQLLLTELTVTFQDNGGRPTGSTPAMFVRGGAPPATKFSNDCHAQVKCPQCNDLGHQKENCRKWRQLHPTLHVKTITEPKHNQSKAAYGKGKSDGKPSGVDAKLAAEDSEGVACGMAFTESGASFADDTAVDGC